MLRSRTSLICKYDNNTTMTIKAKFSGHCKLCGEEWEKDFDIHYSREPRAICTDEKCFNEQKKKSGNVVSSYKQEIVTVKPEADEKDIKLFKDPSAKVLAAIAVAHDMAVYLYPELDTNTNTFGQIRSKLTDQLLLVWK